MMSDLKQAELDRILKKLNGYYILDGLEILDLALAIQEHDEDVPLPMTSEMTDYFEADGLEKRAKEIKEKLRDTVIAQMKDLDHPIKGIKLGKQERLKYNNEVFYEWVKTSYPTLLADLALKAIDSKRYGEMLAKKLVGIPSPECYDESTPNTLTCQHPKKRK
jgi:hypothetical protein